MNRTHALLATALAAGVALAFPACGSSERRGVFSDEAGVSPLDASSGTFVATDSGFERGCKCSDDLHAVLNCDDSVLATCPPDKGCLAGACIDACLVAAGNKSSVGCDYFVYPPPFWIGSTSCTGVFVANDWGSPVTVTVTRGAQKFDAATFGYLPSGSGAGITYAPLTGGVIPPGQVALLLLNQEGPACPAETKAATGPVAVNSTGLGDAFRVQTSAPVVAYDIFPYGGGASTISSATLLIPTSAWGDNYIGTTAFPETVDGQSPWLGVVASEDDTVVTLLPPVAITGGPGVAASPAHVPVTYNLKTGQYVQLFQTADLTGTIITANKPIGSWAGNRCTFVPAKVLACDGLHQQIPPVRALGSSYVAARYRNRHDGIEERPPWRVLGAVDGTVLTYEPPQAGAPLSIDSGQLAMFDASGPFVVKSQDDAHPFFFASYMTSCDAPSTPATPAPGCVGDPEFVNVIPPDQYLSSYVFFTDPTYSETNLVFVRKKAADGEFKDVTLDCVGELTGWMPVAGDYEYTRVDLVRGNFEKQGACDNGRHKAKSDAPFGLTVWGWGSHLTLGVMTSAVSYGYPAGASIRPINNVVVPAVVK